MTCQLGIAGRSFGLLSSCVTIGITIAIPITIGMTIKIAMTLTMTPFYIDLLAGDPLCFQIRLFNLQNVN